MPRLDSAMTLYSDFRPYHFDAEHSNQNTMMAIKADHTRSLKVLSLGSKPCEQLINFDLNCVRGRSHSPRSPEQRTKHEALQNCFHPRAGYGADLDVMGGKRLVQPLSDVSAKRIDDYSPRGWSPQYHDIDHQASKRMFSEPPPSAVALRTPRSETVHDVRVSTLADAIGRAPGRSTPREQAHQRNLREVWKRSSPPKPLASPVQRNRSASPRRRISAHSPTREQGVGAASRLRSTPPPLLTGVPDDVPSEVNGGDGAAERRFELSALGQNVKLLRALQNQASNASSKPTSPRKLQKMLDVKDQQKKEAMEAHMNNELSKMQETLQETEFRRTLEKVLNEQLEATWSVISAKLDIPGNRTPAAGATPTHRDVKYGLLPLTPVSATTQTQMPITVNTTPQNRPSFGLPPLVQAPENDNLLEAPLQVGEGGGTPTAQGIWEDPCLEQTARARLLSSCKVVSPFSTIGTPSTTCPNDTSPRVQMTRSGSFDSFATTPTAKPSGTASPNANLNCVHTSVQQPRNSMGQRPVASRRATQASAKSWTSRRAWK